MRMCVCRQASPFHTLYTASKNSKKLSKNTPYARNPHPTPLLPGGVGGWGGVGGGRVYRGRGKMFQNLQQKKCIQKHTHLLPLAKFRPHPIEKGKITPQL